MFLIIYDKSDLSTVDYIKYLKKHYHTALIALEVHDLIKFIAIKDTGNVCIWQDLRNGYEIDFKVITGIYFRLVSLPSDCFAHYQKNDRVYVKLEWWSYLAYRMQNFSNCINNITIESLSSIILDFGFCFQLAKKIGFNVPQHFTSSNLRELKNEYDTGHPYILRTSTHNSTNFMVANPCSFDENAVGLIEKPAGDMVLLHLIDDAVFGCKLTKPKTSYFVSSELKNLCISLAKSLNLRLMQYIFVLSNDGTIVLMHFTHYPNWLHSIQEDKEEIYSLLSQKLLNTKSELK